MIPVREAVAGVQAYGLLPGDRRKMIRMDLNENAWGCSPRVLEALREIDPEDIGVYPYYADFLAEIASVNNVSVDNLVLSNGADDIIRTIMQVFVDAGEKVLVADPSFGIIALHAQIVGANLCKIPYGPDLAFPLEKCLQELPSAKLLAIVRPDSPTGTFISRDNLQLILESAPNCIVMLDETYHHFLGESCLDLLESYPNLIIIQSFSKAYALAGLRIGLAFAQREVVGELRKVALPFAVNALAVKAGMAALKDTDYLAMTIREMKTEKIWLQEQFDKLGYESRDSFANFILVNIGERADEIAEMLKAENVYVKNLNKMDLLKGWYRITINRRPENEKLLSVIKGAMS